MRNIWGGIMGFIVRRVPARYAYLNDILTRLPTTPATSRQCCLIAGSIPALHVRSIRQDGFPARLSYSKP